MSYNVDNVKTLSGKLTISRASLRKIKRMRIETPECCFLDAIFVKEGKDDDAESFDIEDLEWYGEGSGYAFEDLLTKVLPFTKGTMEVVVTWEGGDSVNGLRIVDGTVTKHEVEMKLGKKIP